MAKTGTDIINRCSELGQDYDFDVYTEDQWIGWINDAQNAICLVRPDAKSSVDSVELVAGSKQTLPEGSRRLLGIVRNMGSDGSTPGRVVRGPVPNKALDGVDPLWHTKTGSAVSEYTYSEEVPDVYWVYKAPVSIPWYLELITAKNPTDIDNIDDELDLDDIYAPAVIEWCMYRGFARDSERSPNWTKAGQYFSNFFNILGVKRQSDMAVSPKVIENQR